MECLKFFSPSKSLLKINVSFNNRSRIKKWQQANTFLGFSGAPKVRILRAWLEENCRRDLALIPFWIQITPKVKNAIQIYTNIFGQHTYTYMYICYMWGSKRKNRSQSQREGNCDNRGKVSLSMRHRLAYTGTAISPHSLGSLWIHWDAMGGMQHIRGQAPTDALRFRPSPLTDTKPVKRHVASDTCLGGLAFQIKDRCWMVSFLGRFHTRQKATPFLENPRQAHVLTLQLFLWHTENTGMECIHRCIHTVH